MICYSKYLRFILLFACVAAMALGFAQPARADGRWRYFVAPASADPNKVLRSNDIRALAYEQRAEPGGARLWVGADKGLQSFNGRAWQDHTERATGRREIAITALAVDALGHLWLATELGVAWLPPDGKGQQPKSANLRALTLVADDRGGVYAGTEGDGVWYCTEADCQSFALPAQLSGGAVQALLYAGGRLWVGTAGGLFQFDTAQKRLAVRAQEGRSITALALDDQGCLWIGTPDGVTQYDTQQSLMVTVPLGPVSGLAIDRQGHVWAVRSDALLKWDLRWTSRQALPDSWEMVPYRQPAMLRVLLAAPDGMLWVGTDAGLGGLDGSWESYVLEGSTTEQSAAKTLVNALVRDPRTGELWAGTNNGVMHYAPDADHWDRVWTTADGLPDNNVRVLWRDHSSGEMWAATEQGVSYYNSILDSWPRTWTEADGLPGQIYALLRDDDQGELWAGTYGGVYVYTLNARNWRRIGAAELADTLVLSLARDSSTGSLWAGTDSGLWQYLPTDDRWTWIAPPAVQNAAGSNAWAWALAVDSTQGKLWAGMGGTLYAYDWNAGSWSGVWRLDNLENNKISTLLLDDQTGLVWIGSNSGLVSFDPETGQFGYAWTAASGLGGDIVTAIAPGDKAGELWIGTSAGVSHMDPEQGPRPWAVLTRAWSGNQNVLQNGQLALYGSTNLECQFGGGSFSAEPGELHYAYRLVDLDQDFRWQTIEQGLAASYEHVKRGKRYTLELWVRDQAGRDSEKQTYPLYVSILPFSINILSGSGLILLAVFFALASIGTLGYVLRGYPSYAVGWGTASGQPVRQLIPLIVPLRGSLTVERVQAALQKRQAFTTPEQVQSALDALARQRMLRPAEENAYRFISPPAAWLHRLFNGRRIDTLAEAVRSRHPLYAGARTFFTLAGFKVAELNAEAFLLVPESKTHPQADYGYIYTRLIAGRSPEGGDFENVAEVGREEYGGELEHRLAFVVSNRRPSPGARLRLYEIRQRWGLAIVHIDSELFGQVKPNMPAGDILNAQIDQATGRQNLYRISSPVSDDLSFFGREVLLQQLIDLIDAGQPVGIFGLRKTGKTSVTQRLQGRLSTRRVIAAVDTQGTARDQGILSLYTSIIGAFVSHIEQYRAGLTRTLPVLNLWPSPRGRTLLPTIARVFLDDLKALQQHIGGDERLLLILDEVDRLLPAGDDPGYEGFATFFGQLRAANQGLKILDFILIGVDPGINRRDKWGERDNELYQALREVWMPLLEEENAAEMIESIGFQMGVRYEPEALHKIVNAGGGQPFIIRQICAVTVQDSFARGPLTIDMAQVEQGVDEFVFQHESYLTELWRDRLDVAARAVLTRLAQSEQPIPRADLLPSQQRQEALGTLGSLEERTLIRRQDGGYVIGWGVLHSWIRWIELGLED